MIFDILTIFPGIFESPLRESILGKACQRGILTVRLHNIRDYALDKHQMTDDRPFGGGEGMVMKPEPIVAALEAVSPLGPPPHVVLLSPQGRLFTQDVARRFRTMPRLVLVCGRYEGVDERVAEHFVDEEISIGDFILTGGELAALVIVDAVARLLPGVLGNEASPEAESFAEPVLEHPHYTRPQDFRGYKVPEVLLSGNHERIRRWRRMQALARTRARRPDLFSRLVLSEEDRKLLDEYDRLAP
ncbi:MAG: tRNA (guanosine(37)-N1)-methyltransferase TrmD [Desulfacinum sp.]|jgi:tRNA (guanine37-N1)-methyltransferase|nr:tRNA (guanosine(37)-N1)-methyltransferase TrmD [Desulfacinum sp.]MBZ4659844.1 tRNA (guanine-N1)-methyltransferase [Desulfacinum sp.]